MRKTGLGLRVPRHDRAALLEAAAARREEAMDQICLVVPITPGKTQDARDFMRELEEQRKPDYDRSERRIGITKEAWYLVRTPGGDQFVAYMETPDFGQALSLFSGSQNQLAVAVSLAWAARRPDARLRT